MKKTELEIRPDLPEDYDGPALPPSLQSGDVDTKERDPEFAGLTSDHV